ncbi:p-loop containing nucleoside triphosphate hydrolase [Venustampulla echinocandica]|uniref:ATP-dependent RNA helicase n=1 Tax=Venustampulla echinocandica TaxID=2656787 RepID=A0A370TGU0_9HELO|nr:p-loop containing nucleoside triphosphate hydrolase [Venustampulla echinocandica]RDL34418.1 p-loop containing nucleoside triphosphate hydrolase [Venustampulla echinocandica]
MQDAKKSSARRHPYKGKKAFSSTAAPRHVATPATTISRVSTPPLMAPIPLDTPRFSDLAKENLIHPVVLKTITEDLKFDHMMPVQAATLHELLANRIDVLAQAKTGTGKTIAFLLPAIQTLINRNRRPGSGTSLLVISPTRELAMQIAKEATALLKRLPQYKVGIAIGGTNKNSEEKILLQGCDIVIGTPGRLYDHLGDERIRDRFRILDTLVLDEADRLLDMGFMNALKDIVKCLPDKVATNRQGMLFSATIAPHVEKVAHLVLAKNYKFISTIPEGEKNTHDRVPQHLIVVPNFADVAAALVGSLRAEIALEGASTFKTIIFAPTAALVDFYGAILEAMPNIPKVSMLHSRLSQGKRTSATNAFREAKSGILVATDVVARGMDFPLVTNVFQVGIPADKESYVHRLGRTARAGKEGRGTFIVTSHETFFPQWTLKEITFEKTEADLSAKDAVRDAAERMDNQARTYQGWLGYYKAHTKPLNWDTARLVEEANKFALEGLGAPEVPTISKSTVGKMGLKGVRGLNIVADPPKVGRPKGGAGGGRGGSGGGGEGRSVGNGGRGQQSWGR